MTGLSRRRMLQRLVPTAVMLATGCSLRVPFAFNPSAKHHIGYVTGGDGTSDIDPGNRTFLQTLRDLGHVEGNNLSIEMRFANFNNDLLPNLMAELIGDGVELIVTSASPAAVAAKRATQTVPIVFMEVNDPVGQGLVANLAHPGGNVTGVSTLSAGISGKRIDLLCEAVPA